MPKFQTCMPEMFKSLFSFKLRSILLWYLLESIIDFFSALFLFKGPRRRGRGCWRASRRAQANDSWRVERTSGEIPLQDYIWGAKTWRRWEERSVEKHTPSAEEVSWRRKATGTIGLTVSSVNIQRDQNNCKCQAF